MLKIITTSWDDGHPLDLRLAELLHKHRIRGTFYIPKINPENSVMSCSEIQTLAQGFEVGGHTYGHIRLTSVSQSKAREEILNGKKYIDDLLGKSSKSFCFPGGNYNKKIVTEVTNAGYDFGRTTILFQIGMSSGELMHTTIQMYLHNRVTNFKHCIKRGLLFNILENGGFIKKQNLIDLVQKYLRKIDKHGGIFHLWGHSWEIQDNGLWSLLEEICKILSRRKDYKYLTNSETWRHCSG